MTPMLRPVLQGDEIQLPAEDSIGFVRKRAPVDGFAVDLGETCAFLSAADVSRAQVELKLKQRNGNGRR